MFSMPGLPEMILIFGVVFLLFGGKKLPELGRSLGEGIRNLQKGMKDAEAEVKKKPDGDDDQRRLG
jgi:sec-independent protein translocase protein TatA